MNNAIYVFFCFFFYRTQFCPLSFKIQPFELIINYKHNKVPLTLIGRHENVTINLDIRFKLALFKQVY